MGRFGQLKRGRSSWNPTWVDIGDQMRPYGARVWTPKNQRNRGDRRDSRIINSKPLQVVRTNSAGLMAGVTSPAREWFGLSTVNKDMLEEKEVRQFLDRAKDRISAGFSHSNLYKELANATYPDITSFGTAALIEEEEGGLLNFESFPIGQFYLDVNKESKVDTCFRELELSCRQIVQKFGLTNCSQAVKTAYNNGDYDAGFIVIHAIQPNDEYKAGGFGAKGMRFASCWFEFTDEMSDRYLRESGYHEFPVFAPRWSSTTGDAYGHSPGWDVLGDCKELQHHEVRKMELIDKISRPPLAARGNVREPSLVPGAVTRVARGDDSGVTPIMTIDPRALAELREHINEIEQRIEASMHADLWRRLLDDDRNERATATEIEGLRQETMLMLGPLLENLNPDLLEPLVVRTFNIYLRAGLLGDIPDALQGQGVKVEFSSIMHQMQQTTGLLGIRTLMQELVAVAQIRPEVVDKIDGDALVDELAEITGINPDIILSKDEVAKVRQHRAEQQAAQQNGQAMLAATQGVKNLSNADPAKLQDLASVVSPVAAAQVGALAPLKSA